MNSSKSSTAIIITVSIIAGILLLILASVFLKSEEKVTLPVKVEEFSDFQCPACGAYYPVVKKIIPEFGSDIAFVYRHFPLTSLHQYAYEAAIASEAAREQGKFDAYHDKLFENQEHLTSDDLLKYATELGLDLTKFKADLNKPEIKARVDADIAEGEKRGITGTPTFYVNGRIVVFKATDDIEAKLKSVIQEKIDLGKKQAAAASEGQK